MHSKKINKVINYLSIFLISAMLAIPGNLFTLDTAQEKTVYIDPGSGKDLSAFVNKVINEATPKTKIIFKKGMYTLSKTIEIRGKNRISFIAEEGVFLVLENLKSAVIWISDSDNIVLSGFHARHKDPVFPGQVCIGAVIGVSSSHDIVLQNLELNGSGTHGVWISRSVSVRVLDSWIHSNSVAGIFLNQFADNIVIERNRFEKNPHHIDSNFLEDSEWKKYIRMNQNTYDAVPERK